MKNRRPRKGFTLVEILIVVVILGILAAIVIPQFTNASDAAKVSSSKSQLQALRAQLELFRNNNTMYPAELFSDDLTDDVAQGLLALDPENNGRRYLQQAAHNPFHNDRSDPDAGYAYGGQNGAEVGGEELLAGEVRLLINWDRHSALQDQFSDKDAIGGTMGAAAD